MTDDEVVVGEIYNAHVPKRSECEPGLHGQVRVLRRTVMRCGPGRPNRYVVKWLERYDMPSYLTADQLYKTTQDNQETN